MLLVLMVARLLIIIAKWWLVRADDPQLGNILRIEHLFIVTSATKGWLTLAAKAACWDIFLNWLPMFFKTV